MKCQLDEPLSFEKEKAVPNEDFEKEYGFHVDTNVPEHLQTETVGSFVFDLFRKRYRPPTDSPARMITRRCPSREDG